MDFVYFVLFVSILIFIHEFGHFAFAKLFGVKVLTFSIGFGPKLLRVRGKETEYCLGLLPFGGFVKMLEESKSPEPVFPEDRARTFEAQALYRRVIIVLAGPAMNLIFPIALYTSVYLEDRTFYAPVVGSVLPGKPAEGKLFPGDVILKVDGEAVTTFPEVQKRISGHSGRPLPMVVERAGAQVTVTLTPSEEIEVIEPRELEIVERVGRIGIRPTFAPTVIGIPKTDTAAYRAGLRTFDRIVAVNGRKVDTFVDLAAVLSENRGDNVVLSYERPVPVPDALGGLADLAVLEPGLASLSPKPRGRDSIPKDADPVTRAKDVLERTGIETAEMYVAFVPQGSSEWRAGVRAGDRLTHLNGAPQRLWKVDRPAGQQGEADQSLVGAILREPGRVHELSWTRDGERMSGTFRVRKENWDDELGQHYERYVFRTTHWMPRTPPRLVPNPHRLAYAVMRGLSETKHAIEFISVGLARVVQGKVSLSAVSGPITLYDVAGDAGAKGSTYFVWAMAITSVNLGLINLLPIPVLDGGHLLLLLVEWARRRPVSLKTRELSSLVGMSVLVLLMLVAFKNDVSRKWGVSVVQMFETKK